VVAADSGHADVVKALLTHPDMDVNALEDWELSVSPHNVLITAYD